MTRTWSKTEAGVKLLQHGPLTRREFREITGWPLNTVNDTLAKLVESGRVAREGQLRSLCFRVQEGARA